MLGQPGFLYRYRHVLAFVLVLLSLGGYLFFPGVGLIAHPAVSARVGGPATATSTPVGSTATATATVTPDPGACMTSWRIVPSPNQGQENMLNAIAFAAPDDGWAVGKYSPVTGGPVRTLALHWDGTAWTVLPSGNPSANLNELRGLSVISSTNTWAVGITSITHSLDELALNWNGQSWIYSGTPGSPSNSNELMDVVALAPNNVWAIGTYYISFYRPYALHWNGSSWTHMDMPVIGSNFHHLQKMAAANPNDIWAVGYYRDSFQSTQYYPFIERWNSTMWDLVPLPAGPGQYTNVLIGVDTVRDTAQGNTAWAVGWYNHSNGGVLQNYVIRWDGTSWANVPTPNVGQSSNQLSQVLALADNDVWAVGTYQPAVGLPNATLIMHWDGTAWSVVPSPNLGTGSNVLNDITISGDSVWAAGYYYNAGGNQTTLIARYDRHCPFPTATPTSTATQTPTPTPTHTPTATATVTPTATATSPATATSSMDTATATPTPVLTNTPVTTVTPTNCPVQFNDVNSNHPFYPYIRCLACRNIVSGYPCGDPGEPCPGAYYRPNSNVTRGQTAKIVAESAGFANPVPSTQQTFEDVAPGSTFWRWVERLVGRGIIGGYPCGGPGEPCVGPSHRSYFRPGANVTRGQLAKIVSGAAGWTETPSGQTFADVSPGSTFYLTIERIVSRGIVSGYPCGGPFEPCLPPDNRPYFRPGNNATRGQMSKIAAQTFFPNCQTLRKR